MSSAACFPFVQQLQPSCLGTCLTILARMFFGIFLNNSIHPRQRTSSSFAPTQMATISTDQLSPFLSYLQKRMDFIAQVATSPPSWCLLTDFNSLIKGFINQKALTKNIIRSHQGTES